MYMLLLDATKAFDRVKYSTLFNLLTESDICPLIVRLLLNMYLISTAAVSWNGVNSDQVKLCNGVKQGVVMSPLLVSYLHKSFIYLFIYLFILFIYLIFFFLRLGL